MTTPRLRTVAAGGPSRTRIALGVRMRAWLLGGAAIGAAISAVGSVPAQAGGMPTQGSVDLSAVGAGSLTAKNSSTGPTISIGYSSASSGPAVTADVDVSANPKTLIDWSTFNVAAGNTVNFHFASDQTTSNGQIVLNRVLDPSSPIDIEGTVNGIGGPGTTKVGNGNIWFLDSAGIIVNGSIQARNVFLSTGSVDLDGFFNASGYTRAMAAVNLASTQSLIDITNFPQAFSASLDATTGDILLTAASGALRVRAAEAARDAIISAPGGVNVRTISAGRDISLTATAGQALIRTLATAGGDVTLLGSTGATLKAVHLTGAGPHNILVQTSSGDAVLGTEGAVDNTNYISNDSGGPVQVSVQTLGGSGDAVVGLDSANLGSGQFGSVTSSGGDASVTLNQGDAALQAFGGANLFVNVGGAFSVAAAPTVAGDYTATAGSFGGAALSPASAPHNFTIEATASSLTTGDLTASGALSVKVDNGGFTGGSLSATSGEVAVSASGAIELNSATAGADVSIIAGPGGAATVGVASAQTDITVQGGAGATLGAATLGGDDSAVRHLIVSSSGGPAILGAASASAIGPSNTVTAASDNQNTDVEVTSQGPQGVGDALVYLNKASSGGGAAPLVIDVLTSANSDAVASLQAGDLNVGAVSAGRDVVLQSVAGAVVVTAAGPGDTGAVSAGDDLVIRAATGVSADGALTSGTGAEGMGAADALVALPGEAMTAFGHTYGSLADGSHIDIVSSAGGITLGAPTVANDGDIRLQAPGTLNAQSLQAGRDVLLDVGAVSLGSSPVTAGADVAVRSGAGVAMGAVSAGDDVAIRASGTITLASVTSGTGSESVGAADYLIAMPGEAMTVFGHGYVSLTDGSQIDIVGGGDLTLQGSALAQGSTSDIRLQTSGTLNAQSLQAGRDVVLDVGAVSLGSNAVTAGADVAVNSGGDVTMGAVSAGDDVAIRSPGTVSLAGVTSGTGAESLGAADYLIAAPGEAMTVFGHTYGSLTDGGQIDIIAGAGGITLSAPTLATGADVRLQTTGTLNAQSLQAGRDVVLDVGAASLGSNNVTAGADVAVKSGGAVAMGAISAGDDVAIRAPGTVTLAGVTSGTGAESVGAADYLVASGGAMTMFGHTYGSLADGSQIDISVGGNLTLQGPAVAQGPNSDVRLQTSGTLSAQSLQAGRDVALDAGAVSLGSNSVTAGADVAVKSGGDVATGTVSAGDDVAIRSPGKITLAGVTSGTGPDSVGAADYLVASLGEAMTAFGHSYVSLAGGGQIDIVGGGDISLSAATSSNGGDIRLQTPGTLNAQSLQSAGDVVLDTGAVSLGSSATASADVAVKSSGAVAMGTVSAGDDVAIRSPGAITLGGVTSGTGSGSVGAADNLVASGQAMTMFGHTYGSLADGSQIDIVSGGNLTLQGPAVANGSTSDVRLQAPGTLSAQSLQAGRDVALDAGVVSLGSNAVTAGADVAVKSGGDVTMGAVAAGDDVAIRAPGKITVAGVTSGTGAESVGAADYLVASNGQAMTVFGHTYGSLTDGGQIDIVSGGGLTLQGSASAQGGGSDIRLQAHGTLIAQSLLAGRDVVLDAGAVSLGSNTVTAGADVAVKSGGDVAMGAVAAGDDVAIRSAGKTTLAGVTSGTGPDSVGAADYLVASGGAVTVFGHTYVSLADGGEIDIAAGGDVSLLTATASNGGDVRVQTPGTLNAQALQAGGDVALDAGAVSLGSNTVTAGSDVAVRSGSGVTMGAVSAGDDVAIRAPGTITLAAVTSGTGAESVGAADYLVALPGEAMTVFGHAYGSLTDGSQIDIVAGGNLTLQGLGVAQGQTSDVRLQTSGTLSAQSLQAGRDVVLDAGVVSLGSSPVTAGSDVAVKSGAGVALGAVSAGDDVAIRAPGTITVAGVASGTGSDSIGAADYLVGPGETMIAFGHAYGSLAGGGEIDIAGGGDISLTAATVASNGGDIRLQTPGTLNTQSLQAAGDVVLDAGVVSLGSNAVTAGADVAVKSGAGVAIGAVSAGDDVAIRAPGTITLAAVTSGTGAESVGAADYLTASPGVAMKVFGHSYGALTDGAEIDIVAGGDLTLQGAALAQGGGSDIRLQTPGTLSAQSLQAGRDVVLDAGVVSLGSSPVTAGSDVAVESGADVAMGAVSAGDDVAIRAPGTITLAGVGSGTGSDSVGAADYLVASAGEAMTMFAHTYLSLAGGGEIDVVAGGNITLSAATTASNGGDIRLQTPGTLTAQSLQAAGDVALDVGLVSLGSSSVTAGSDVAVKSGADVTMGAISAGDDVAIRAPGTVTLAAVTSGNGAESVGAADYLVASGQAMTVFGHTYGSLTDGSQIDIVSGGDLTLQGPALAQGATSDVRLQTPGTLTAQSLQAGRDVVLDVGLVSLASNAVTAGADVAVKSDGDVTAGAVSAGDDVAIRSPGTVTLAGVASGTGQEAVGAADYLIAVPGEAMTMFGHTYGSLANGGQIDIAAGGDISISAATTASNGGDIRLQTPGTLTTQTLQAGGDVALDAGAVSLGSYAVTAGSDVAVKSGADVTIGAVSAGDDVAIRSPGTVSLAGVTSGTGPELVGAADYLVASAGEAMTLFGHTYSSLADGSHIDIISGSGGMTLSGPAVANGGDIRLQTPGTLNAQSLQAGRDVALDAGAVSLGSNAVTAGADVAVKSGADVTIGAVSGGDDVAIRAPGAITLAGVTSGTGAESVGAADYLVAVPGEAMTVFGHTYNSLTDGSHIDIVAGGDISLSAATAANGGDVRLQTPGTLSAQSLQAGRDVVLDAGVVSLGSNAVTAGADVAVKSGADVAMGAVSAGDDVAIRAPGAITLSSVTSGTGLESVGAADYLIALPGEAMTVFGHGYVSLADGSQIDIVAGGDLTLQGSALAQGSTSDVRLQSLSGSIATADLTAGRDVVMDAAQSVGQAPGAAGANTIHAIAGDVAIWAHAGDIDLKSAEAGGDLVLRSPNGAVTVLGTLVSDGPGANGPGPGAWLAGPSNAPILLFGSADVALTGGGVIDVGALNVSVQNTGGAAAAIAAGTSPASDVRIATTGADPKGGAQALFVNGAISAGQDVALDATTGGSVLVAGAITAGRDIAARSLGSTLEIGSGQAGGNIVLRAANGITVDGALDAAGTAPSPSDPSAWGSVLFQTDATSLNGVFDLSGSNVDVRSSGGAIQIQGVTSAVTDVRLQTDEASDASAPDKAVLTGDIMAGRDILLDATSIGSSGGSNALSAGGGIALRGRSGGVAFSSGAAGGDLVVRTPSAVSVGGALSAGAGSDSAGVAGRLLAVSGPMVFAGAPFALSGGDVDVVAGGSISVSGGASASDGGADARFQSAGALSVGNVAAGRDVLLDGSISSAGDVTAGEIQAGRDVAVHSSGGGASLASASAGQDLVIRAQGAVTVSGALTSQGVAAQSGVGAALAGLDPISYLPDPNTAAAIQTFSAAGSNIDVKAASIAVSGQITSAADARFQASGSASFAGATSATLLFVRAKSLTVQPNTTWSAPVIRIESTSPDGLVVGDPPTSPSGAPMAISNATFGQFQGPAGASAQIELFAGDTSSSTARGPLDVGALTVPAANRIGEIDLYAGGGPSNPVVISGAFAPDADGATNVVIGSTLVANGWTPDSILVINDGAAGPNKGSIGSSVVTVLPFGLQSFSNVLAFKSVALNATNQIIMGSSVAQGGQPAFTTQMAGAKQGDVQTLLRDHKEQVLASGNPVMLLTAGSLTVRVNGGIIQENTSGFGSGYYTGVYLTGAGVAQASPAPAILNIGRLDGVSGTGQPIPNNVEIFLSLNDPGGAGLLSGQAVAISDRVGFGVGLSPSQFYRLNYCVIATLGTCATTDLPVINVQPAAFDLTNLLIPANLQDAEDPTVTGAANEEIWRKPE